MDGPATLADHLDTQTDAIIELWRSTVEQVGNLPEAERLSRNEFADHVPELLDRMADRLRGRPVDVIAEGREHGRSRWRQGFDVADLVTDMGHLRTALIRATFAYARDRRIDLGALEAAHEAIHDILNEATAESVRQFQEVSILEIQAVQARFVERSQALEDARITAEAERIKLRTLLDHLPVGVWVIDAEGSITCINQAAVRAQGFSADEVVGRVNLLSRHEPPYPLFRPDGTPYRPGEIPQARALRGETVVQEEMRWRTPGGERIITVNAAPLINPAGTLVGVVAVVQDITGRKQAEEQLRHQLDFTGALSISLGEGIVAIDREGRGTFVNPAAEAMLGWSEAELLDRVVHDLVHYQREDGSPYPATQCPMLGVIRTGTTVRGEDVFTRKDGTTFPVIFTSSPIVSAGQVVGSVKVFRDITEHRRLVAELADSEARFRSIAEQSPVMIWRADTQGRCDYFNQTWFDFRGRTREQEIGDGWAEGVHPDDREQRLATFGEALGRREPLEMTYRLRRHDGQYRWITDRGTPLHDARGTFLGFLGSCIDVTPQVELQASLQQQKEMAEEASRHKTRLMSALSHDARTPLNAVVLSAQLLELHCRGIDEPEVQECLRTIRNSVGNVLDLLGDLLNLTKIDAGAMPPEPSRFELLPVLAESVSSIEPQARVKGLDVRLDLDDLGGSVVETDRAKLKQILCNLLSNALRYTERGHIRVSCGRTADQVRIAVEDTGVGIAPSDQQRIFDEFATLENPRRPTGEGTGLGLAICRRLANLLRGEITLQSVPGQGSTFTLALPATVLTTAPADVNHSAAEMAPPASGAILVAEDHLTSRQTLAKVLRRMGYRVLEAGNGLDALDLARQERQHAHHGRHRRHLGVAVRPGHARRADLRPDRRRHPGQPAAHWRGRGQRLSRKAGELGRPEARAGRSEPVGSRQ
jgi:two-component system sensor histidine kinase/response regulator